MHYLGVCASKKKDKGFDRGRNDDLRRALSRHNATRLLGSHVRRSLSTGPVWVAFVRGMTEDAEKEQRLLMGLEDSTSRTREEIDRYCFSGTHANSISTACTSAGILYDGDSITTLE